MNNQAKFFFLLLILVMIGWAANAQTSPRLVEISKEYVRKEVVLNDGLIFKYTIGTQYDTALFFNGKGDTYDVEVKFTKRGGVIVVPTDPIIEKIDGSKATFAPLASWTLGTAAGWYGDNEKPNSIAYSNSTGATATYTFTGTKIELWAERLSSHGTGTITLNGVTTQANFKATPLGLPVKIYESPLLTRGTHTIKLTVGSGYCLLDYFILTK